MYITDLKKIREQLNRVVSTIDPAFVKALLALHKRLAKERVEWAVGGDLGEALRTVQVEPDCIEILTSKKGASGIFLAVSDCAPAGLFFQTHRLSRTAKIGSMEYPVHLRSHYFEFELEKIKFKVYGDLQYKVGNWEWGDRVEFSPEYIFLVGIKTAIVPLQVKLEIYHSLGWTDRAERISQVLNRRPNLQVTA